MANSITSLKTINELRSLNKNTSYEFSVALVTDKTEGGVFVYDTARFGEDDGVDVVAGWVRSDGFGQEGGQLAGLQATAAEIDAIVGGTTSLAAGGGIAGTLDKPTVTYSQIDQTVTVGAGTYRFYHTSDFTGVLTEHTIAETVLPLAEDTPSYLIAQYNNGTPQLAIVTNIIALDWGINIPVNVLYANNGVFSIIDGDETGNGLANKMQMFFYETQSYTRAYGLSLSEVATRVINISAGKAYLAGSVPIPRLEDRSDNGDAFLRINNGDGTFTRTPFSQYPNTQYDDKTGTLKTLTDGKYGVIWVYRCMSTDCVRMHIMLGNGDYDLNEAKASQPPEKPLVLSTNTMLIGRIIVLKGADTATQIDSAFDTQFAASTTTNHAALTGLEGTSTAHFDIGDIKVTARSTAPTGWLLCDGSAVSRTTYANLFAAIGTIGGVGDGTTTFNVPNLKGRVVVGLDAAQAEFDALGETGGAKTHTLTIEEMPSHTHTYIKQQGVQNLEATFNNGNAADEVTTNATTSSTGGGQAHNNLQPYMALNYVIKY